jgi:16S rRNA (cytosine967-C5)-methyltransferase
VLAGGRFVPLSPSEVPDSRDRAVANRLVTTALRHHGHLNLIIAHLLDRGVPAKSGNFDATLRLALAQLLYLPELGDHSALFLAVEATKRDKRTAHLAKLINAVLRRAQKEADQLREAPAELLFPETLRDSWIGAYGKPAVIGFADALLTGAALDLTLKDTDPGLIEALGGEVVMFDTVRVESRDRPIEALPGYAEGQWWVQDVAASLPARLIGLPAGARVLDLCAAPGGKTAQLCKAGYAVTALDNDTARLERLKTNLGRLGYAAEIVEADAASFAPEQLYDAVLLDAPCSATGTLRRHPEVVWHRDAADIAGRVALQRRLLVNAAKLVAPGGTLVYCVCSLEPEEGVTQARWARNTIDGLEVVPIDAAEIGGLNGAITQDGYVRTYPGMAVPGGVGGTLDGFFIARFRRR